MTRRAAGFTLVELVMTIALLTVGVPALISLGTNCLTSMHQGTYATTASMLAQEKLEQVLADRACSTRGFNYIVSGNYPAESSIPPFSGYTRSVTIAADSTYSGIVFRNVSVTVTAPDGNAVALSTWVLNP